MNKLYRLALVPLFFCLAAILPAAGNSEEKTVVRVSGRVRLVGSGPLPELVITGSEMEWYIDKDDAPKLFDLQHRTVTVEGNDTVRTLIFANGSPAGERHTLKNIKIISIQ